jgi:polyisoprenoid-binding protein YceI
MLKSRRGLIAAALAGALALLAIGVAIIYFVVFPSSAPAKLALGTSPATPSTTSAASPGTSDASGSWTVTSGSQAGYRVRETLAFVGAPSDAVGRTSSVHGTMTVAQAGSAYTVSAASLTVDVNTLTSDRAMRDQRIHFMGLQSDQYPKATFVLSSPIQLPSSAASGQTVTVSAAGQLTIHGVTRAVTIPLQARLTGSQIQVAGSITFPFSEFGMTPPSIAGFVSVENNATMEFAINFARAA